MRPGLEESKGSRFAALTALVTDRERTATIPDGRNSAPYWTPTGTHAIDDHPAFRPDIEGLRAVAVILVVAFHAGFPLISGGFVGVDVFFVLSGYLITGLLVHEVERTGRVDFARFYARRARRLLPASAVMVLVTVFAESRLLSPLECVRHIRAAMAAAVYVSNVYFHQMSGSYFSPDNGTNPFLHTWSLAVEEQFYFAWPLLIETCFALSRSRRWLVASLLVLTAGTAIFCAWLSMVNRTAAFYEMPPRAWEFGLGGIAALVPTASALFSETWRRVIGWLGFFGILAGATMLTNSTAYPGPGTLLPVVGTVCILVTEGTPSGTTTFQVGRLLRTSILQLLGRLSYSWYLWHWPVLALGMALIPAPTLLSRCLLIVLSLALAAISHVLVENPIRFNSYLIRRPMVVLMLTALVTVTSLALTRRAEHSAISEAAMPAQRRIVSATNSGPHTLIARHCFLDYRETALGNCAFGDVGSPRTIAIFGDSHMAQWFSAYEAVALAHGWRLMAFTKSGCPGALVPVDKWTLHLPYPECTTWRNAAIARILALHPVTVVIAASDGHVTAPTQAGPQRLTAQQWQDGMRRTLTILDSAAISTVVLHDSPGSGFDVPTCLSRALAHGRSLDRCGGPRKKFVREDVYPVTQAAAAGLPHVTMLDLSDYFCDRTWCPPIRNGVVVYRDPGHITDAFIRTLSAHVLPADTVRDKAH